MEIVLILVAVTIIWVFRRSFKELGTMAEESLTVSTSEVKASNISRLASVSVDDETVKMAKENQAKLNSINI